MIMYVSLKVLKIRNQKNLNYQKYFKFLGKKKKVKGELIEKNEI